jgi:hypothetical protein
MATQLSVANGALRLLGVQRIDSLSDTTKKAARVLNDAWSDAVRVCFESYNWNFASERASLSRSEDTPAYGWDYYYVKPSDWMRTINITKSDDEEDKLRDFVDEGGGTTATKGLIATNAAAVYLRYVSSNYMTRYGNWPQNFADYVSAKLAEMTCQELTGNDSKMQRINLALRISKHDAINIDTTNQATKRLATGRLVLSRYGSPWRSDDGQI